MAILKNSRWEYFAHQVGKGAKPVDAYIAAGYSKGGADQAASKLLKNAEIKARIAEIQATVVAMAVEKTSVDKAWVMNELIEVVKMAKAAEQIIDKDGGYTGEAKQNLAAANKALELIGKELAMFVDRKEIRTSALDGISPDDLAILNDALATAIRSRGENVPAATNSTRH